MQNHEDQDAKHEKNFERIFGDRACRKETSHENDGKYQ